MQDFLKASIVATIQQQEFEANPNKIINSSPVTSPRKAKPLSNSMLKSV